MPSQEFEIDPHLEGLPSRNDAASPYGIKGDGSIQPMTGVVAPLPPMTDRVYLDPNIAFERALIPMVEISRKKRADYATDQDEFSNFRMTAQFANFEAAWVSATFNVQQKMARIQALRANGRTANVANEALEDTLLDLAVYGILSYAMFLQDKENDES